MNGAFDLAKVRVAGSNLVVRSMEAPGKPGASSVVRSNPVERRPLFTAFGIPVSFDPFFLLGAFLIYQWSDGGRTGMYTVVAMVVFVVLHEFGHALTAKAFGARPEICVTFLGGYASFATTRRLTTRHHVAISLAGPGSQLLLAVPVVRWAVHRALDATSRTELAAALDVLDAVAWAGVLLGFLNLVPLWPLDGGHIASSLLTRAFGDRAVRAFLTASLVISLAMLALSLGVQADLIEAPFTALSVPRVDSPTLQVYIVQLWRLPSLLFGDALFVPLVTALGSWGQLAAINRWRRGAHVDNAPTTREIRHEDQVRAARTAERESWASGHLADFPRWWRPSPWVRGHVALLAGDTAGAGAALAHLADGDSRNWLVDRPDRPEIGTLLAYVPPEAQHSLAVLEARVHHGSTDDLVALATTLFIDEQSAEPLYLGAAGLATRGLADEAMAWLHRAVNVSPDPHRISVERAFHGLHRRSDFQQLLGEAQRATATR